MVIVFENDDIDPGGYMVISNDTLFDNINSNSDK
jgi:hypothetical protein